MTPEAGGLLQPMHRVVLSLLLAALPTRASGQSIGDSLTVLRLVAGELRADSSVRITTVAESAVPRPLLDSVASALGAKVVPASDYYLPRCPWAEPLGGRPTGYEVYVEPPRFAGDSAAVAFSVHCQSPARSLEGYERPEQLFFNRHGGQWRLVGGSLIVAAASAHSNPDSDFLRLVPAIVDVAVEAGSGARVIKRPLFVDVGSFASQGSTATGRSVDSGAVAIATGRAIREVSRKEAIDCSDGSCWIPDDGLFVTLDSLARTSYGFRALVTAMWTDRRPSGRSAIGEIQLEVWFAKRGATWVRRRVLVTMET